MSTASNHPLLHIGAHPVAVRRRSPSTSRLPRPRLRSSPTRDDPWVYLPIPRYRVPAPVTLVRRPATATPRESKRRLRTRLDVSRRAVTRLPTRDERVFRHVGIVYFIHRYPLRRVASRCLCNNYYTRAIPVRTAVFRPRRRDNARCVYWVGGERCRWDRLIAIWRGFILPRVYRDLFICPRRRGRMPTTGDYISLPQDTVPYSST